MLSICTWLKQDIKHKPANLPGSPCRPTKLLLKWHRLCYCHLVKEYKRCAKTWRTISSYQYCSDLHSSSETKWVQYTQFGRLSRGIIKSSEKLSEILQMNQSESTDLHTSWSSQIPQHSLVINTLLLLAIASGWRSNTNSNTVALALKTQMNVGHLGDLADWRCRIVDVGRRCTASERHDAVDPLQWQWDHHYRGHAADKLHKKETIYNVLI